MLPLNRQMMMTTGNSADLPGMKTVERNHAGDGGVADHPLSLTTSILITR